MKKNNVLSFDQFMELKRCYTALTVVDPDVKNVDPGFHYQLDWFCIMIDECSFNEVFNWLGLSSYVEEFLVNPIARACGYENQFFFSFSGITLSAKPFADAIDDIDISMFDVSLPAVRLDVSGSGLQFLRSIGLDVDTKLRDPKFYPWKINQFRSKRIDFAFDMINFNADAVDQIMNYCETQHTPNDRLCCMNKGGGGICYKIKRGGEKTVYLGSKNSTQMLRVYDKRLQYVHQSTMAYVKPNPYNNPQSWIRMELQTRNERGFQILFGDGDWFSILRLIHDDFWLVDYLGTTQHNRKPIPFWDALFPWNLFAQLVKNKDFVFLKEDPLLQLYRSTMRILPNFMIAYSRFGSGHIQTMCNDILRCFNRLETVNDRRRAYAYNSKLSVTGTEVYMSDHGIISDGSMLSFKW